MEKEKLFSLVALVCIIFFYSIPSSKRSVYLMPAYPFIAIFLAQYTLYITEYRTKVTRVFAAFMASITAVVVIAVALTMAGAIKPVHKPSIDTGNGRVGVEYVRVSLRADNLYPDSPFGYSGDCLLSDVQEDQHQDPVCDDCIGLCH